LGCHRTGRNETPCEQSQDCLSIVGAAQIGVVFPQNFESMIFHQAENKTNATSAHFLAAIQSSANKNLLSLNPAAKEFHLFL